MHRPYGGHGRRPRAEGHSFPPGSGLPGVARDLVPWKSAGARRRIRAWIRCSSTGAPRVGASPRSCSRSPASDRSSSGWPAAGSPSRTRSRESSRPRSTWSSCASSGFPSSPRWAWAPWAKVGCASSTRRWCGGYGVTDKELAKVHAPTRAELERLATRFHRGRPALKLRDRVVIVVDDGLATGGTARAAVEFGTGAGRARRGRRSRSPLPKRCGASRPPPTRSSRCSHRRRSAAWAVSTATSPRSPTTRWSPC